MTQKLSQGFIQIIIPLIISIIIVTGLVYLSLKNKNFKVTPVNTSTASSVPTININNTNNPQPTFYPINKQVLETGETYVNTRLGFQITIPKESLGCDTFIALENPVTDYMNIGCEDTDISFLNVLSEISNLNLMDWYYTLVPDNKSFFEKFGSAKNITFRGKSAIQLTFPKEMNEHYSWIIILIKSGGSNYQIVQYHNYSGWEQKIDQQILSTFRFFASDEKVIQGKVIENNLGCEADATCYLRINNNGRDIKIIYSYGEWPACTNTQTIHQGIQIKVNDDVEIFGKLKTTNEISTCDSEKYYIKHI